MEPLSILFLVLAAASGVGTFLTLKKNSELKKQVGKKEEIGEEEAISRASTKAKEMILDAKNEVIELREKARKESLELAARAENMEKRALERESNLDKRALALDGREDKIEQREKSLEQAKLDVKKQRDQIEVRLSEIAQLTRDEARKQLLEDVEKDITGFIAKRVREAEQVIKEKSDDESKRILVDAMQKAATDYVSEATISTIPIPSDDVKGRIIGREGRNIKAFERVTGVDVIVDESPGTITLSSFDPLRREVAAIAMGKLVVDGRIHPGRIEEIVDIVKRDLVKEVKKTGEELAYQAGASGLPDEIINLLGRFKYRFSYGQNLVKHTLEVMKIGAVVAAEVGADVALVKKACLLHDLGKALTHEQEGSHHHISGEICRKYKFDEKLINAIEAHHGDIEAKSLEAIVVYIADAISGARPGARVENHEQYIKRVRDLEDAAHTIGKEKVKEAFAIHAGREVRVIVNADLTDDNEVKVLSHKIAKHIQDTQTYPGTVTVNVIRETRDQAVAK